MGAVRVMEGAFIDIGERLSKREVVSLLRESFNEALADTFRGKVRALGSAVSATINAAKYAYKITRDLITTKDLRTLKRVWEDFKDLAKRNFRILKEMAKDWKSFSKISAAAVVMLIVGGGVDFEGGMPDLDTKIAGIGAHRNLLSHTILGGLTAEVLLRFFFKAAKKAVERGSRNPVLLKAARILEEYEDSVVAGMWFGMAVHLFKDSRLFGGNIKPIVGLKGLSMQAHKGVLASNAAASGLFALEEMKKEVKG